MSKMWMRILCAAKKSPSAGLCPPALKPLARRGAASHRVPRLLPTLILLAGATSFPKAELPLRTHIVTINNTEPRCDVEGNIIDAHGGCIRR